MAINQVPSLLQLFIPHPKLEDYHTLRTVDLAGNNQVLFSTYD